MNRREVQEIRRRFSPEKDSISHIYGCYVNASGEIVARIDMPLGLMEQEEAEMYLKILKKSLSGSLGRNLRDTPYGDFVKMVATTYYNWNGEKDEIGRRFITEIRNRIRKKK